jgi:hypothetical protein
LDSDTAFILDFRFLQSFAIYKKFLSHLLANVKPAAFDIFLIFDFVEKSLFDGLSIVKAVLCVKRKEAGRCNFHPPTQETAALAVEEYVTLDRKPISYGSAMLRRISLTGG